MGELTCEKQILKYLFWDEIVDLTPREVGVLTRRFNFGTSENLEAILSLAKRKVRVNVLCKA